VVYRKRDRDKAKELATESARLQKEVYNRFDEMRQRYRVAHPELTSFDAWGRIFEPAPEASSGSSGSGESGE
jgi:galactofuranosylgalactofuranosylrhamnosyl-N-acetylglucosaminyl-diphospho-decaprenol beta-1,5/1,6-galactofuranosyltransferase